MKAAVVELLSLRSRCSMRGFNQVLRLTHIICHRLTEGILLIGFVDRMLIHHFNIGGFACVYMTVLNTVWRFSVKRMLYILMVLSSRSVSGEAQQWKHSLNNSLTVDLLVYSISVELGLILVFTDCSRSRIELDIMLWTAAVGTSVTTWSCSGIACTQFFGNATGEWALVESSYFSCTTKHITSPRHRIMSPTLKTLQFLVNTNFNYSIRINTSAAFMRRRHNCVFSSEA